MLAGTVSQRQVIIEDRTLWCLGKRFDTNYPEELRGIIDPSEFYQSIYNINLSRRKTFFELIVVTIMKLFLLVGLIVMIVGFALIATGNTTVVVIVAVIGFVISSVTTLIFGLINSLWITPAYIARLKKAVHDESMYYATQSTPTRWRLDVRYTSHVTTYVNYLNNVPIGTSQRTSILGPYYSIIIDIGVRDNSRMRNDGINFSRNPHQAISYIDQQYPILPLSYPNFLSTKSHDKSLFNQGEPYIHSSV